jgi:hypothetical protein
MKRFVFLCCCVLLLAVAKGGTQPLDSTKRAIASTEGRSARTGTPYDLKIVWGPRGGLTSRNKGLAAFGSSLIETRREEGAPTEQVPEWWRLLMQKLQQPAPSSPEDVSASSTTALLQGDYIFSSSGASYDFILRTSDVQSAIGGFTFDGRGSFTGFQTSRTLFESRTFFRFGGTYTVDSSGVGYLFYLYPTAQTHTIILIKGGDAFFFVDVTSSNFREAGYARRIY